MKCFRLGIILLLSFLCVSNLRGQHIDKKYEKAFKYYEKKEYKASIEICNDILNYLDKNNPNADQVWSCFNAAYLMHYMYKDSTYELYNPAVSKTYIEIAKDCFEVLVVLMPELKIALKSKYDYINSYLKGGDDYLNSLTAKNKEENTKTSNNIKDENSSNRSVQLTVSANGKSFEQAITNALKSSIDQVFGAFITSQTVVANDSLLKDELVSVSVGSVENYEIVSKFKVSDSFYNVTLVATISTNRLLSFVQKKDASASINGNLFVQNIELQRLNEENETKTLKNISYVLKKIIQKSLDFEVNITDPVKDTKVDSLFNIKVSLTSKFNKNISNLPDYLYNNLKKLAMTKEEISSYKKIGKEIYGIIMPPGNSYIKEFVNVNELENAVKNRPGLTCYFMSYKYPNSTNNGFEWVKSDIQFAKKQIKKGNFSYNLFYGTDIDTLDNNLFYLRNKESFEELIGILNFLKYSLLHFDIDNGIEKNYGINLADESRYAGYTGRAVHKVGFSTNFYPFFQTCYQHAKNIIKDGCGNDYDFYLLLDLKKHNELKKKIHTYFLNDKEFRNLTYAYYQSDILKFCPSIITVLPKLDIDNRGTPKSPVSLINLSAFVPTDNINSHIFEMSYYDQFNIDALKKLKQYKIKSIEVPLKIE
jgi:hypothetical protein